MLLNINDYCIPKLGSGHRAMTIPEIAEVITREGQEVFDCWIDVFDRVTGFSNDKIYVETHCGIRSYSPEDFSLVYLTKSEKPFRKSIYY